MDVGRGRLPVCFEAEERSQPGVGELLQLVSGRQVLGVVRERTSAALHAPRTSQQVAQYQRAALSSAASQAQACGPAAAHHADASTAADGKQPEPSPHTAKGHECCSPHIASATSCDGVPKRRGLSLSRAEQKEQEQQQQEHVDMRQSTVLELVLEGDVVALGVRRPPDSAGVSRIEFFRDRTLIAAAHQDKLRRQGGQLEHVLMRAESPLVRHIYFTTKVQGAALLIILG